MMLTTVAEYEKEPSCAAYTSCMHMCLDRDNITMILKKLPSHIWCDLRANMQTREGAKTKAGNDNLLERAKKETILLAGSEHFLKLLFRLLPATRCESEFMQRKCSGLEA